MPRAEGAASVLPGGMAPAGGARPRARHGATLRAPANRFVLNVPLEDLACAGLFAFFAVQGSIPGIAPSQALELTASPPTNLTTLGGIAAQAIANAAMAALMLRRPRLVLRGMASLRWAGLLAMLAIASTAWSLDPWLTLRRAIPFAMAGLFGVYFASRYSTARQLSILRMAMVAVALGSVAMVTLTPAGLDPSPGHATDWQGVFTQKNACGRMMVLAIAVILFGDRLTLKRIASLGLFAFVLAMSGSRAAWLIAAAMALLWVVARVAKRAPPRYRRVAGMGAVALLTLLGVSGLWGVPHVAALLGRDATLSGRTAIWAQVEPFLARRPLLGYGYEAFWRGRIGPSLEIGGALRFLVLHAHNGFLEVLLELGAAGLALFAASWLRGARRLWLVWRSGEIGAAAFPMAILALMLLYDVDENTLLLYNGIFWPLYVAALASLEQLRRDPHHALPRRPHEMLALSQGKAAMQEESAVSTP